MLIYRNLSQNKVLIISLLKIVKDCIEFCCEMKCFALSSSVDMIFLEMILNASLRKCFYR